MFAIKISNSKNNIIFKSSEDKYQQTRKDFNSVYITNKIKSRAKSLPQLMDIMVETPANYTNGNILTKDFSNKYLEWSVPFYKRIKIGNNNKKYCQNYAPEISMINKIIKLCNKYLHKKTNINNFNATLENALEKYSNTTIKRSKYFIA